ncbi:MULTISPECIES: BadF/BadG/BcrA/BcrD ATPase family protein [unclassified Adlercreutzia]|uniref:BadF/BadG/BcrA/BcrD ATPase family protein n=1 Tax=unclassified Adlercreutzia TaxID=2636013 RepID=UPI0013EC7EF9|nr:MULTISPECIES: BadF/BadG/BcrA/BcrD ATPase family protein [unclassified Adlercreutzia]
MGAARDLLLAVDGGGSSTELLLADAEGAELARFQVGSTSFKSVGPDAARAEIGEGVRRLRRELDEQGAALADVRGVWGLSGCDSAADAAAYRSALTACGLDLERHHVCNDALLALRTVADGAGVVVVAGTGSVALCVDAGGAVARRIGGWGYQVSDLGSGCWAGAALLREALLHEDSCREDDPAFALVREALAPEGASCLGEAAARLTRADELAALARIALECAASPACEDIRRQAARYLAGYAASLVRALSERGDAEAVVALAGGLFRNERFRNLVVDEILARTSLPARSIRHVSTSPAEGGIRMARAWARDGRLPLGKPSIIMPRHERTSA